MPGVRLCFTVAGSIFLWIFSVTCSYCQNTTKFKLEPKDTLEVYIADSARFNMGLSYLQCFDFVSFYYEKSIYLYSLNELKHYKKIDLSRLPISSFKGYFIKNQDSIFILTRDPTHIYITDWNSNIIDDIPLCFPEFAKLVNKISNNVNKSGVFEFYSSNYAPMVVIDNNIFLMNYNYQVYNSFNPVTKTVDWYSDSGYYHLSGISTSPILSYSKNKINRINCETGIWPKKYTENNSYIIHGSDVSRAICDNKLIFSFGMDHNLYVYDSSQLIRKVFVKSKYIDSLEITDKSKINDPWYIKQSTNTFSFYKGIVYDKYRKLFYRIAVHKQVFSNQDGTINLLGDNPWSIIITDTNFKVLDEIYIPAKTLDFNSIIVTANYLLIHRYYENNYQTKHDFIGFNLNKEE